MSETKKVSCPICGTALKTNAELSGGAKVQCPRCRTIFNIPQNAIAPDPPSSHAPSIDKAAHLGDASTATIPASKVKQAKASPALNDGNETNSATSRGMLMIAGFAVLFVAGAGLAIFCFSGTGDIGDHNKKSDEGPPIVKVKEHKRKKPKVVPLIQLTKEEEKSVKAMTDKAVVFLKRTQQDDGSWRLNGISRHYSKQAPIDFVAMGALTLLECGEPPDGPHVQKAAAYVRKATEKMTSTYGLSLAVLFLSRLHDANKKNARLKESNDADLALIKKLALRITAGQEWQRGGGWSYDCPVLNEADENTLFAVLKTMGKRTATQLHDDRGNPIRRLPKALRDLPIFRPWDTLPKAKQRAYFGKGGDNSNTQFAVLGLLAAEKLGVPVHQPLRLVAARFRHSQNRDASWGYSSNNPDRKYPSMTCAGLLGLAVEYGMQEKTVKKSPKNDPAIKRALKLLSKRIGGRKSQLPEMYFLWSMERVAVLFQLKEIEGKDWYRWGMDLLQKNQDDDGSWTGETTPGGTSKHVDTCFALLFLQRTNLAADLTDKLQELERLNQQVAANNSKKE